MNLNSKVFVMDPGHGGPDPGAVANGTIFEKNINLAVVLQIYRDTKNSKNYSRFVTRYEDKRVHADPKKELAARGNQGKNSDLFCSFHCDSSLNKNASGFSIYCNYNSPSSKVFAQILADEYKKASKLKLFGIYTKVNSAGNNDYYGVLRAIPEDIPAIIFEMGFLSNESDRSLLISKDFPSLVSKAFIKALDLFFGFTEKPGREVVTTEESELERLIKVLAEKRQIILAQAKIINDLSAEIDRLKKGVK